MNSNKVAGLIILGSLAVGASPFLADMLLLETTTSRLGTNATVTGPGNADNISIGANPGALLAYGDIPSNVNATKTLSIETTGNAALVSVSVDGNISGQIEYERIHHFTGTRELELTLAPAAEGFYAGNVTVKTERARGRLGEGWLEAKRLFY